MLLGGISNCLSEFWTVYLHITESRALLLDHPQPAVLWIRVQLQRLNAGFNADCGMRTGAFCIVLRPVQFADMELLPMKVVDSGIFWRLLCLWSLAVDVEHRFLLKRLKLWLCCPRFFKTQTNTNTSLTWQKKNVVTWDDSTANVKLGILRIWLLKFEKPLIMINNDDKDECLYSQYRLEWSLAAVRLGLLHTDGLIYGLHLKDICQ